MRLLAVLGDAGESSGPGCCGPGHSTEGLKRETRAEPPLPRLIRTIKARNKSEVTDSNINVRVGKVRVVRSVQRLCAELKLDLLGDGEGAKDAQIRLEETWTTEVIGACISEPLR